jgi:hypothetical protein
MFPSSRGFAVSRSIRRAIGCRAGAAGAGPARLEMFVFAAVTTSRGGRLVPGTTAAATSRRAPSQAARVRRDASASRAAPHFSGCRGWHRPPAA